MYELKKKIGKVLINKFVGTGPSSYEKRIYRAAVSQRLRSTAIVYALAECTSTVSCIWPDDGSTELKHVAHISRHNLNQNKPMWC
jgi:hypothetical protein